MSAGFNPLIKLLFCLDPFADITNNTQQTRPILINELASVPFAKKSGTIPAFLLSSFFKFTARLELLDQLREFILAIRMQDSR